MELELKGLQNTFLLRNILIPVLLIMPILWFTIPAVSLGTDNLRMIKHFDTEEANLVEFAGKTYSQGLVPLEYHVTYPQLYYYIAGIVLFPFTFLKGINYQVIVIVLRSFNILAGLLTAVFLYFFCLRFFKSIWLGILSSLLLTTSPDYMGWLINSRPHPIEIFFLLATFYFCFRIAEQYRPRFLAGAVIFIGLAAATKFGGLFMLPVVWAACLYSIIKLQTSELIDYLKTKVKLNYFISSMVMVISVIIPIVAIFIYIVIPEKFYIYGIKSLDEFLSFRNFRLLLLMMLVSFLGALFWFIINLFSNKFFKNKRLAEEYRYVLALNKSILFLFYIFLSTILIFFLLNPTFWLFPLTAIKKMVLQFAMSTQSTSLDPGLHRPIFDPSGLVWFKRLFDNNILNGWFGLLIFFYFIFEIVTFRRNWGIRRNFVFQRGLLWLYSLTLFLVLFIFLTHRPHHYLLPIGMVMGILLSFGVVEAVRQSNPKFFKCFLILLFGFILISAFYLRAGKVISLHQKKLAKNTDTGVAIGKWLESRFDEDTIIWIDTKTFYIPPKLKNVFSMHYFDNINEHFSQTNKLDPDLLIITSKFDASLANAGKVNRAIKDGRLKGFKQIKIFKYEGPLALEKSKHERGGMYKEIYIYAKTDN